MAVATPGRPVEVVERVSRKVRIEVTEEDIRRGFRQNSRRCPVALALIRAEIEFDFVTGLGIVATARRCYLLPTPIQEFIFMFDQGCRVRPVEFDLEVPS